MTFACGHQMQAESMDATPICPTCQERRVQRVKAPAPRFRGFVTGPCAQFDPAMRPYEKPLEMPKKE